MARGYCYARGVDKEILVGYKKKRRENKEQQEDILVVNKKSFFIPRMTRQSCG